jgi:hypothetical protein
MQAATVVFSAGLYRRGEIRQPREAVLAASTMGAASEMLGQGWHVRALPRSTDQRKAYAKRESVLVVTVGNPRRDGMVNGDGHPNLPHARSDPAPSVPPRAWGFLQIRLSLLHPATSAARTAATSHQMVPGKPPLASEVLVVSA